jgi:hypothetical protein
MTTPRPDLRPRAWPTLDDVADATARAWVCPLNERIDRRLAVDLDALRTPFADRRATDLDLRRDPWTAADVDRVVAHLWTVVGVAPFGRLALSRAAAAAKGRTVRTRALRERLIASGRIVAVAPRGRASRYRLVEVRRCR